MPTAQQLDAALLTADDLGAPFTVDTGSGSSAGSTSTGCPALDQQFPSSGASSGQHEANFTGGSAGPFVSETVTEGEPAALSAEYAQIHAALTSCRSWTITSGSTRLPFTLSRINFGGPDSTAVRLDGEVDGVQVNGYIAFEEFDTVALGYVYFQIGGGSSQPASKFYTLAVAKIEHVLHVTPSAGALGS